MADGHPVDDVLAQLKASIEKLRQENHELEEKNSELQREVDEEKTRADEEEELRDNACDTKDRAVADLRGVKDRELAMLRRLEFSMGGLCPLCLGIVEHKTGCDLKLAIWRIDHELVRTEYAD